MIKIDRMWLSYYTIKGSKAIVFEVDKEVYQVTDHDYCFNQEGLTVDMLNDGGFIDHEVTLNEELSRNYLEILYGSNVADTFIELYNDKDSYIEYLEEVLKC